MYNWVTEIRSVVSSWKTPLAYARQAAHFSLRGLSWHQKRCLQALYLPAMGQGRHHLICAMHLLMCIRQILLSNYCIS